MKKFISGVIVGVLLFASASAFADSVGIFGKKVTGIYTIMQDGKKVAEAGIINGSAYAPVRAVSDAVGASLTVEGRTIIIESGSAAASADETTIQLNALNLKRTLLLKDVQAAEGGVKMYETTYIPNAERNYQGAVSESEKSALAKTLEARKAEYEQRKAELADLQKQLTELDAEIAALKN
ncbi:MULTISPECIES: hypothetical protein [unclassified Paenibacillus]|uniref:hypothetical protein n=1 Tax=unclassified Paenibacillus TaxID=185978 RepID=UPI002404E716|nr:MULTISPECIES: hypothetical protein [unclassified Paenibacillus]MDF9845168.1 hypothetical protein [Paenibacillus sp. PastF-2]MDF9850340.1 hypothetical protein [Paenibacillus sp. PastM-2]MDF9856957.1 hypothetical protein [Paenibacillus sp. PastF-1]MDH6482186.1 hypothetical protein [Paenibacillus sp. PastH-2]MDH6509650.1 hypothetical protein [Paenibacillus sp. PastM-3]